MTESQHVSQASGMHSPTTWAANLVHSCIKVHSFRDSILKCCILQIDTTAKMESEVAAPLTAFDKSVTLSNQTAISTQHDRPGLIQESDVNTAFIAEEHKEHVLAQIKRLKQVLSEPIPDAMKLPGWPLDKSNEQSRRRNAAQRQLARLTIIFRRLMWKHSQGELDPEDIESWMADIIDASLYDDKCKGKALCCVAAIMDPIFDDGERQEMEVLVQELIAENVDDVIELHNVDRPEDEETVVPEKCHVFNRLGDGAMFQHSYADSKSDDESIYRVRKKRIMTKTPEKACTWTLPKQEAKKENSPDKPASSAKLPHLRSPFVALKKQQMEPPQKKMIDLRWPRTPR